MELSGSNIKKFVIFSQKKAFLRNPEKFLIFQETELSYISGNENPKKPTLKKLSIFWELGNLYYLLATQARSFLIQFL